MWVVRSTDKTTRLDDVSVTLSCPFPPFLPRRLLLLLSSAPSTRPSRVVPFDSTSFSLLRLIFSRHLPAHVGTTGIVCTTCLSCKKTQFCPTQDNQTRRMLFSQTSSQTLNFPIDCSLSVEFSLKLDNQYYP